jgi:two-component system, OmpR family, sensor kinase
MAPRRRWLSRLGGLPIRVRLTIAFAVVMAAVLAATGALVYTKFAHDLTVQIDSALRTQAEDIAALVQAGRDPDAVVRAREQLAQVYASNGRRTATTEEARHVRLLTVAQVHAALAGRLRIASTRLDDAHIRVRALAVQRANDRAVVAVADPLDRSNAALKRLRILLLVAGPLALLLASVAGYEVAGAALRPVERMRRQAGHLTGRNLSDRLTVPNARDEIRSLAQTFNALLDHVEEAVARERRVVSDASHELRTPLTTLRAEVDLALRGQRDAEELREALRSASIEAARMTRLADDLLVLARADQGRLPLKQEPHEVGDLLRVAAGRASAAADAQGRRIVAVAGSAGNTRVRVDEDRIVQALDNLVGNSLSYGGGTISLEARAVNGRIELHVADEGGGFSDDVVGRAFERFARGRDARASGSGSGLGLAIVEAIARAHGGEAGARNRPQGGADVWIALPLDRERV